MKDITIDLSRDLYLYTYLNNPAQEDETVHMTVERDGQEMRSWPFKPDVSGQVSAWL